MLKWFRRRQPHEKFPQLLKWQKDDNVEIGTWATRKKYTYLGCDGEYLIFKSKQHPYPILKMTAGQVKWNLYENTSYSIREACEQTYLAQKQLSSNQYNEFLQIQKVFRDELLSQMKGLGE